jgi:hypothetical protein
MNRLQAILRKEIGNLSSTERDSIERFIQNVIFEKDKEQAEIIYSNYISYLNDLSSYTTSSNYNVNLRIEMDRVYSRFNMIDWN